MKKLKKKAAGVLSNLPAKRPFGQETHRLRASGFIDSQIASLRLGQILKIPQFPCKLVRILYGTKLSHFLNLQVRLHASSVSPAILPLTRNSPPRLPLPTTSRFRLVPGVPRNLFRKLY